METPESLLTDEQISKICCPYTVEYDAVLEEILTYATTWMNLEDVSVAERQILYDPIYMKC